MSDNDSDQNSTCDEWYLITGAKLEIPVYYVIIPICLCLGFIGRIVCLFAFYRQSKKEPAYFYQIVLTSSEFCGLFFTIGYCCIMIFVWNSNGGSSWWMANYFLMWYTSHLGVQLVNMNFTINQLLIVAIAADRIFAILKPILYKTINHKFHQKIAFTLCIILGITTSVYDCFRNNNPKFNFETGLYDLSLNLAYLETDLAQILSDLRTGLRFFNLLALIILNILLTITYRKRMRKVAQMTGQTVEAKKEKRQAKGQNTLTLLATFQCVFNLISTLTLMSYYMAFALKPSFDDCEAYFWSPLLDATNLLIEVANFYVVVIVSKQFRKIISDYVPCFRHRSVSIVTSTTATG